MMRKLICLVVTLLVIALVSCSREEGVINNPGLLKRQAADFDLKSDWNVKSDALAFAVHQALVNNREFSSVLKNEVLRKESGDYEVLLSTISGMSLAEKDPVTRVDSGSMITIGALFDQYARLSVGTKSSGSFIDDLQNQYPNMQISVPVHVEDWDVENYIPTVVFVPEEFSDGETLYVPGYNAEGESVLLDAINEPSEPVVVIGMSERVGIIMPELPQPPEVPTPSAPASLVASQTSAGIMLTWQSGGTCTGYRVYRKLSTGLSYSLVKTLYGQHNVVLEDCNVLANENYSYYVKAFNLPSGDLLGREELEQSFVYSQPSNVVTCQAPSLPAPVTSLETYAHGTNVELRWNCDQNQNAQTDIYSSFGNITSYALLNSIEGNTTNYIYAPPIRGRRILYQVNRSNSLGQSSSVYDFIYPPYRNTSVVSNIYVSSIRCNGEISDIESWVFGSPEFYLKIVGVGDNGEVQEFQDKIEFSMESRDASPTVFNRKVYDWWCLDSSKDWYSTLTFVLVEYDPINIEISQTIGIGISVKDTIGGLDLNFDTSFKATFTWKDADVFCGNAYLRYFESPESILYFPNHEIEVQLSDNPN